MAAVEELAGFVKGPAILAAVVAGVIALIGVYGNWQRGESLVGSANLLVFVVVWVVVFGLRVVNKFTSRAAAAVSSKVVDQFDRSKRPKA